MADINGGMNEVLNYFLSTATQEQLIAIMYEQPEFADAIAENSTLARTAASVLCSDRAITEKLVSEDDLLDRLFSVFPNATARFSALDIESLIPDISGVDIDPDLAEQDLPAFIGTEPRASAAEPTDLSDVATGELALAGDLPEPNAWFLLRFSRVFSAAVAAFPTRVFSYFRRNPDRVATLARFVQYEPVVFALLDIVSCRPGVPDSTVGQAVHLLVDNEVLPIVLGRLRAPDCPADAAASAAYLTLVLHNLPVPALHASVAEHSRGLLRATLQATPGGRVLLARHEETTPDPEDLAQLPDTDLPARLQHAFSVVATVARMAVLSTASEAGVRSAVGGPSVEVCDDAGPVLSGAPAPEDGAGSVSDSDASSATSVSDRLPVLDVAANFAACLDDLAVLPAILRAGPAVDSALPSAFGLSRLHAVQFAADLLALGPEAQLAFAHGRSSPAEPLKALPVSPLTTPAPGPESSDGDMARYASEACRSSTVSAVAVTARLLALDVPSAVVELLFAFPDHSLLAYFSSRVLSTLLADGAPVAALGLSPRLHVLQGTPLLARMAAVARLSEEHQLAASFASLCPDRTRHHLVNVEHLARSLGALAAEPGNDALAELLENSDDFQSVLTLVVDQIDARPTDFGDPRLAARLQLRRADAAVPGPAPALASDLYSLNVMLGEAGDAPDMDGDEEGPDDITGVNDFSDDDVFDEAVFAADAADDADDADDDGEQRDDAADWAAFA
jgi:hypothetical protein